MCGLKSVKYVLCHFFITHSGEISGTVVENSIPRCSTIPSERLEVKLKLTFESSGNLVDKLKNLLRQAYTRALGITRVSKLKETKIKIKIMKKSIFNQISISIY